MNKKLLAATLPLLGGAIIVGAGFSAWVFNGTLTPDSVQGTVNVTELLGTNFVLNVYYDKNYDPDAQPAADPAYAELTEFTLELDQGGVNNTSPTTNITAYVPAATAGMQTDVVLTNNVYVEITYNGIADDLTSLLAVTNVTLGYSIDYDGDPAIAHYVTPLSWTAGASDIEVSYNSANPTYPSSFGTNTANNPVVYQSSALDFDWTYMVLVDSEVESLVNSKIITTSNGQENVESEVTVLSNVTSSVSSNQKPSNADQWEDMSGSLAGTNGSFALNFAGTASVVDKPGA